MILLSSISLLQHCGSRFCSQTQSFRTLLTARSHVVTNGLARQPVFKQLASPFQPTPSRPTSLLSTVLARFTVTNRTSSAQVTANIARQRKIIGYWFASCAGLTFVTISIGGLTRLTESGLSMVDWHPFKEVPPATSDAWEAEFEKYKQFPEWKVKNREITLEQFKFIWYMEYAHRTLGRTIGAIYFIPAAIFWAKNWLNKGLKIRVAVFGTILGFQGLLGWYMVKSGLEEKQVYAHEPRVSQYRLAAHLGTAMFFYSLLFWNALRSLQPKPVTLPQVSKTLVRFKWMAMSTKGLIFFTALSGALVAGLDAGLVYNSWPKMADRWIPSDLLALSPKWKNFFENVTTVQFDHRHLGESTALFILALWAYSLKMKLPRRAHLASHALAMAVVGQVLLGICTLLFYVPTEFASAHQIGALTTLSMSLWLNKELAWISKAAKSMPK